MESKICFLLFISGRVSEAKRFVMNLAGPLQHSSFKTYRVAKVAGCAAFISKEMMDDFNTFKVPEGKAEAKRWKALGRNLEQLNKGMNHELAMCALVEDNNFGIIKRFESHERVPKDYRKRAEVVQAEYKKEQQASKKAKSESKPQNKDLNKSRPSNSNNNNKPDKEGCWNCDALGHFSKECTLPRRNRKRNR